MHALVVTVSIAAGQFEASNKVLRENVVPQVKKAPGFIKGYWAVAEDHTNGLSIVVFNTKAEAENASQMARTSPTPPGVTINHVEIREVVADA
jgi:hypothetical protein